MTKTDKLKKILLRKLKCGNQPQLLSNVILCKEFGIKNTVGNFVANAMGQIRRAGMIKLVGHIRDGNYYVFTEEAKQLIALNPNLINEWINKGFDWQEKVKEMNEIDEENDPYLYEYPF